MGNGIFGSLFDFNGDGKLNAFEQGLECQFFNEVVMKDEEEDEIETENPFAPDFWNEDD